MSRSDETENEMILARNRGMAARFAEEPAPPIPLQGVIRPPEQTGSIPAPRREEQSEAYQTQPAEVPVVPSEPPPSAINTDVRRHGLNPFLTSVTLGILAAIIGFLIVFSFLVIAYLRYTDE